MRLQRCPMSIFFLGALFGTLWAMPGRAAQPVEVTRLPGYVDLEALELYDAELASLEISIHEPLIGLVASAVGDQETELGRLLRGLRSIRLRTFPLESEDTTRIKRTGVELARTLERQGWENIVRVRNEREDILIYLRTVEDRIAGMMLMAVEAESSVTVVNIVGEFDPEQLGRLGRSLNIDPLEALGERTKRTEEER